MFLSLPLLCLEPARVGSAIWVKFLEAKPGCSWVWLSDVPNSKFSESLSSVLDCAGHVMQGERGSQVQISFLFLPFWIFPSHLAQIWGWLSVLVNSSTFDNKPGYMYTPHRHKIAAPFLESFP